jgi:hypothetical protein
MTALARRPRRPDQHTTRRRISAVCWYTLYGAVERQHAAIARRDPNSPRIRPTLGSFRPRTDGAAS